VLADDGGSTGVEEVLHAGEVRVEGEGASTLRRIRSDGQQAGERIGETGSSGARLRERGIGFGVGAMTVPWPSLPPCRKTQTRAR